MKRIVVCLFLLSFNTMAIDKAIYGVDNRMDLFESYNQDWVELARSTAAMIPNHKISLGNDPDKDYYTLKDYTLEKARRLCPGERFAKQITPADCTGFLVTPNMIVTAGHCVKTSRDCSGYRWAFGFSVDREGDTAKTVLKEDVYRCVSIVSRRMGEDATDYALIKLDREVSNREPLKVRTSWRVSNGDPLVLIGYPSGLPAKIAPGAEVLSSNNQVYFMASTDSFGGNSGSPVFNANTGVVEGILTRGEADYVKDKIKKCYRLNYCDDESCRGELVNRITNVRRLMEILKNQ